MLFDTPKTLEAALYLITVYDRMYWELYAGCAGAVMTDNSRVSEAKSQGRKEARSYAGRKALNAMRLCDGLVDEMRRWMQARQVGGQRPVELACFLFLKAESMTGGPYRATAFGDLNALLDTMDANEWAYAVTLEGQYTAATPSRASACTSPAAGWLPKTSPDSLFLPALCATDLPAWTHPA